MIRPFSMTMACVGLLMMGMVTGMSVAGDVPSATPKSSNPRSNPQPIEPIGQVVELASGFTFTEGPTMAEDGSLYFTDIPNTRIHQIDPNGTLRIFTDRSNRANGLWALPGGKMLACEMDGAVVRYDLADGSREVLVDQHNGSRFNACNDLVVDEFGGIYFTDPLYNAPTPLPQGIQAVYYLANDGQVTRLTDHIAAPNGIGLSMDGSRLYVIPSMQAEMLVYEVTAAGKISRGTTFCVLKQPEGKSDTGGDGMTMDEMGNLYITTHTGVQIYSPEADYLGTVAFPEQPANVTFMGEDRKTMVVTARTSLYQVKMPIAGRSTLAPK